MKKKIIGIGVLAVAVAGVTFVPAVQTLAQDALSVFRVSSLKTINITAVDIQEVQQKVSTLNLDALKSYEPKEGQLPPFLTNVTADKPEPQQLERARDFKDFNFDLPKDLENEKPNLQVIPAHNASFSLNTSVVNDMLSKIGVASKLPDNLNGAQINIKMPATVTAAYKDVLFAVTQKPTVDAPQAVTDSLKQFGLSLPFIPDDIKAQLQPIDVNTTDIYLPVLVGVGREIDLGGTTGYIYSTADLQTFMSQLPQISKDADQQAEFKKHLNDNSSAIVWTKDGVLYVVAGNKTDGELTQIARSVRNGH